MLYQKPFKIIHLEDEPSDQVLIKEYLKELRFEFILVQTDEPADAISFLTEEKDINLCIADWNLQSRSSMDGIKFIEIGKLISPVTNFLLLTNTMGSALQTKAAKAGARSIYFKRHIRADDSIKSQFLRDITYGCLHSLEFLQSNSINVLNFSDSIAHILRKDLAFNKSSLEDIENLRNDCDERSNLVKDKISELHSRYEKIDKKLLRVLDFHNKNSIFPKEVDLHSALSDAVFRNRESQRLKFDSKCKNTLGFVDWDLLKICLDNLIDNSIKFTDKVPCPQEIEVSLSERNSGKNNAEFVISVRDHGYGFKKSEIKSMFKPYFFGDHSRKGISSFGIGLAQVEKIVRLHRNHFISGSVEAKNIGNKKGCVVSMIVPKRVNLNYAESWNYKN